MEQLLKYKDLNKIEIIIRPGMVYNKQKSYITELIKKIIKFKFFPFLFEKIFSPFILMILMSVFLEHLNGKKL